MNDRSEDNGIRALDPLRDARWDERIRFHEKASFFLTSSWARVLAESYGYRPDYFGEVRDGALTALMPVMEVNSILTGKRGVSLPFTDQCEPVTGGVEETRRLLEAVIDHGRKTGWSYLELRPGSGLPDEMQPFTICFGHRLDLSPGYERILHGLRDSTRRNIRRAQKAGVRVSVSGTPEALQEFCRMNCMTRREHGLPPQPAHFFRNIQRHVIARGRGMVVLATYRGTAIAGAVYFHFGNRAVYKYGASDRRYQQLRANNLVMWEAIQKYLEASYDSLDFGRTEPENDGLLQFKRGWGTEERPVAYYRYDLRQDAFVQGALAVSGAHTAVFRRMPMPLLKAAGSLLYRHMG